MKNTIRTLKKQKRNKMTPNEVAFKSKTACRIFLNSQIYRTSKVLMMYMPLGNEVHTQEIIDKAFEDGKVVVVPVTDVDNTDIIPCSISRNTAFVSGAYSINEPDDKCRIDENEIDVVLVPGIAFDRNGSRIGFGKGYYDKFLNKTNAVKVGYCYDFQLMENIPTDEHDVVMDYVVTNMEIHEV